MLPSFREAKKKSSKRYPIIISDSESSERDEKPQGSDTNELVQKSNEPHVNSSSSDAQPQETSNKAQPVPEKPDPEVPKRTLKKFGSIPNTGIRIKDAFAEKEAADQEDEEDVSGKPKDQFSNEQLEAIWMKYADNLLQSGANLFYTIMKEAKPTRVGDSEVHIRIGHVSGEAEFMQQKQGLLGFLKENLNNYHLTIHYKVEEVEQGDKLYTNRDKYEYLKQKFPAMEELRKRFDMDLDV